MDMTTIYHAETSLTPSSAEFVSGGRRAA